METQVQDKIFQETMVQETIETFDQITMAQDKLTCGTLAHLKLVHETLSHCH